MIDAKGILTNKHINEFIKDISDDSIISIKIENVENLTFCNLKDFKNAIRDLILNYNLNDDRIITLMVNENKLEFLGSDLKKWGEDVTPTKFGKLNKLFKEPKTKEIKEEQIFTICCGILEDNLVKNMISFRGNLKESIEFINKNYSRNEIVNEFTNKTVFCFEEDFNDLKNWKTLPQLIEEGIIEI